eukprot:6875797-Pyramimonas_sp.AAC.1
MRRPCEAGGEVKLSSAVVRRLVRGLTDTVFHLWRVSGVRGISRGVEFCILHAEHYIRAGAQVKKHKEVLRQLKATKQQIQANEEERWRVDTETQHFRRQEQVRNPPSTGPPLPPLDLHPTCRL